MCNTTINRITLLIKKIITQIYYCNAALQRSYAVTV